MREVGRVVGGLVGVVVSVAAVRGRRKESKDGREGDGNEAAALPTKAKSQAGMA